MRKRLLFVNLFVFYGLFSLFLSAGLFAETIDLSQLSVEVNDCPSGECEARFTLSGCTTELCYEKFYAGVSGDLGAPQLPVYVFKVALPTNYTPGSVTVDLTEVPSDPISGAYIVAHDSGARSGSIELPLEEKDMTIWTNDAFYPTSVDRYQHHVEYYKKVPILFIRFKPFQYNPVTKKLDKLESGSLNISYSTQGSLSEKPYGDIVTNLTYNQVESIRNEVVSFENTPEMPSASFPLYPSTPGNGKYSQGLIIAISTINLRRLINNGTHLWRFIASKKAQNMNVFVLTEDKLYKTVLDKENPAHADIEELENSGFFNAGEFTWNLSGTEKADRLRSWLQEKYHESMIGTFPVFDSLLIIGDPRPGFPTEPGGTAECLERNPDLVACPIATTIADEYTSGLGGSSSGDIPMRWVNSYSDTVTNSSTPPKLLYTNCSKNYWYCICGNRNANGDCINPTNSANNDRRRHVATDFYFSDLAATVGGLTTWPSVTDVDRMVDKNVFFDFYSELTVGRIPVYPDDIGTGYKGLDVLNDILRKMIAYENETKNRADSYRKRYLHFGHTSSYNTPGYWLAENLKKTLVSMNNEFWIGSPINYNHENKTVSISPGPDGICSSLNIKVEIDGASYLYETWSASDWDDEGFVIACSRVNHFSTGTENDANQFFIENDRHGFSNSYSGAHIRDIYINTALENSNHGLVTWFGHGSYSGLRTNIFAGGDTHWLLSSSGARLPGTDTVPPPSGFGDDYQSFFFQASCNQSANWWLDNPLSYRNNLAYKMLQTGAINTIAGTRWTTYMGTSLDPATNLFRPGSINMDSPRNQTILHSYAQRLSENKLTSGMGWCDVVQSADKDKNDDKAVSNLLKYNMYGDPTMGLLSYYDEVELDSDGIRDMFDNCPTIDNYDQLDSDFDGIGDACDKCPGTKNRWVEEKNPYQELFVARLDTHGYSGAIEMDNGYLSADRTHFIWQPDHDLDGTPDACDIDFAYSRITDVSSTKQVQKMGNIIIGRWGDRYAQLSGKMKKGGNYVGECDGDWCATAVHYCALNYDDFGLDLWGTDGFCTNTQETENDLYDTNDFYCDFSFSHGSDDYTIESMRRWERRISRILSPTEGNIKSSFEGDLEEGRDFIDFNQDIDIFHYWNWRRDWYTNEECDRPENQSNEICQSVINGGAYNEDATMYYALSNSVKGVSGVSYLNSTKDAINENYFPSTSIGGGIQQKYARSSLYGTDGDGTAPMKLNHYFSSTLPDYNPEVPPNLVEMPLCRYCYWKIPQKFIPNEDGFAEREAVNSLSRWALTKQDSNYNFTTQQLSLPTSMELFGEASSQSIYAVTAVGEDNGTGYELRINTPASGATWNSMGAVQNWDSEIRTVLSVEKFGNTLYFIGGGINDNGMPSLGGIELEFPVTPQTCDNPPSTKTVVDFGQLNNISLASMKLFSTDIDLYLIGSDSTADSVKIFKMNSNNHFDEIIGSTPPARAVLNISREGRYFFLAGGVNYNDELLQDLWRFDTVTEMWEQVPVVLNGDFRKVIAQPVDGKLVMANPIINGNTTHPAFVFDPRVGSVSDIIVEYVEIPVTAVEYEELNAYCIVDGSGDAVPGIYRDGGCDALQQYNHQTTTYFDYKYTLSGSGKRLFLGGLTGIRTALIVEDGSLQNEYFKWVGHIVNNIQISENRLFAASSDKIRIYEVDEGELTQIGTINADNPRNIRIADGKLFVADGRQISIWNVNGETPVLEREITTSYKVKDLEISDGILYIYEEEYYWYWFWLRKHTKFEVIELGEEDEDEQVVYTTDVECGDSEMMQDFDSVYLGCSNGQHRIGKGDGTALSNIGGEKNYFRDSYTYESKVYQTFSGAVHLSK